MFQQHRMQRQMTDNRPRVLSLDELEALKKDMCESAQWMRAELQRRTQEKKFQDRPQRGLASDGC
jgi:hypothetical protein